MNETPQITSTLDSLSERITRAFRFMFGAQCWIVSVVMVKDIPNGYNTQNKLYRHIGLNCDEAMGKAIRLAQSDFPEHRFHTACNIFAGRTMEASVPSSDAGQKTEGIKEP
jgi:hypothetical protein